MDPEIIVDDPYIYIDANVSDASAQNLPPHEILVMQNQQFNITVDLYSGTSELSSVSLRILAGEEPEYKILVEYDTSTQTWQIVPIGLGETPIKIISASNTSQQVFYNERFIRFTFTLMFNTTNSSLYGTYIVIPAYFNTISGSCMER